LTSQLDLTRARRLKENAGTSFMGSTKVGPFEVDQATAEAMLASSNPHGRSNSEVVKPWANASDITGRNRGRWIIDFETMPAEEAAKYEAPFEYVKARVMPARSTNARAAYARQWWLHAESRPAMRSALSGLTRFLVTPRVAKHRLFAWLPSPTLPDSRLYVFARDDDYFFGVLQSRVHTVWALAKGSTHGDGTSGGRPVYNNTTCFETFPLPWPPGREDTQSPEYVAIAEAGRVLHELRENALNPSGLAEEELAKMTLTDLYNRRPTWLDNAHKRLDAAVFAAYGWDANLFQMARFSADCWRSTFAAAATRRDTDAIGNGSVKEERRTCRT
jgi:hypothetical protein